MILGLQITAIIFSLLMIYFALIHFKKGQLVTAEVVSWFVVWTVTILAVIFPEILREYARRLAISRLFDLMIVGGFILVITMVSSAYLRGKKNEKKIEELVRKEALKGTKNVR